MKTYSAKPTDIQPIWHVIDATDRPLGRLASEVGKILQGKHKPTYTSHILTGDFVIIINASKIGITGSKIKSKLYYKHSGYPGGLKKIQMEKMMDKHPDRVIRQAVKGMLPRNSLARHMLNRLKVYAGPNHPHEAQVGN